MGEVLAEKLIGSAPAEKLPRSGDHVPDPNLLDQPLQEGEVGNIFCTGCGTLLPFGADFLEMIGPNISGEFFEETHYLQAGSCPTCDHQGFTDVIAVLIPL